MTRPLLAEMVGTFVLVFAGTGAIVIDRTTGGGVTHAGVAATFGLTVMAVIYALGDVSGAHINPAVTVAFCCAGRFPRRLVLPYVAAQVAGALLASLLVRGLFGSVASLGATMPSGSAAQSFLLEGILSWFLVLLILRVSTGPREQGILAGIAIGGVVGMEAVFAGPISGASMNPARSLAPAVVSGHLASLRIYLLGPVLGACAAVPFWRALRVSRPSVHQGPPSPAKLDP